MTDKDMQAFEKWVCEVGVLPLTKINAIDNEMSGREKLCAGNL